MVISSTVWEFVGDWAREERALRLVAGWAWDSLGFGEGGVGDLEAVEEEAGAARVDVVGGDALEDFADGVQDGGAVFGKGDVEGGAAAAALLRVGYGFSGGVVVVAELFPPEAGAGAAASVGEDVAALVLDGGRVCVLHVCVPYPRLMYVKSSKEETCFRTSPVQV